MERGCKRGQILRLRDQAALPGRDLRQDPRSWCQARAWPRGCGGAGAHVLGGLAEDVAHTAAIAQPVVHDGDDAHEQGVTGPLRAVQLLVLYKCSVCSDPGQAPAFPLPTRLPRHPASPSRTSGTETPESQSILSPLHVPMNVAAPCGIPRGLAGGDKNEANRGSTACLFPQHHTLQEARLVLPGPPLSAHRRVFMPLPATGCTPRPGRQPLH